VYVLDSSALLAYLNEEPGGEEIEPLLDGALISTINLSEVLQKGVHQDIDPTELAATISRMGVDSVRFDAGMAARTAALWVTTRPYGLSLADRACLTLASDLHATAVTTDRAWAKVDSIDATIHLIAR